MTPGNLFWPDFAPDAPALFADLTDSIEWDGAMRARKTASFGVPYNYAQMNYPAQKFPPQLASLLPALEAKIGWMPNNCLVNFYPDGDSTMGFHADATDILCDATGVAIVSLGEERVLTFKNLADKSVKFAQPMPAGSLLLIPASVQSQWLHGILKQPGAGARMSLTFRRLRVDDQNKSEPLT